MKYLFLSLIVLFLSLQIKAQNSNRVSFFYGFASNELVRSESLDGASSYDGKGSIIFGITYQRTLNNYLSLETGLEYSKNEIYIEPSIQPHMHPSSIIPENKFTIEMITIPLYANFTFFKYFYANAGALIDFELNEDEYQSADEQSGIGFGGGIGAQYTLQNFTLFVNPMIRYHAVIPFQKENYQQHLAEAGVKFGIGYNF